MTIRLCAASLLVSASFVAFTFSAFSADDQRGALNINSGHAEIIIKASQQTMTAEPGLTAAPKIVGVSVPPDSSDGPSWSRDKGLWSNEFPIRDENQIGIGYIVEPEPFHRVWSGA